MCLTVLLRSALWLVFALSLAACEGVLDRFHRGVQNASAGLDVAASARVHHPCRWRDDPGGLATCWPTTAIG